MLSYENSRSNFCDSDKIFRDRMNLLGDFAPHKSADSGEGGVGNKTLLHTNDAAALYDRMRSYRNDLLLNKLQNDMKLSHHDALELFEDVKRFIALCATSPAPLGLSRQIDQAWHIFILITKEYAKFCNDYCGRYIHHEPSDPFNNLGNDYFVEKRREVYALANKACGTLSNNWDEDSAGCTHDCTNGD